MGNPRDGHPWALKDSTRVFERIFHDNTMTGCGALVLLGFNSWETIGNQSPRVREDQRCVRARRQKRLSYMYVRRVKDLVLFSGMEGMQLNFLLDPNQVVHEWGLSGRGPFSSWTL